MTRCLIIIALASLCITTLAQDTQTGDTASAPPTTTPAATADDAATEPTFPTGGKVIIQIDRHQQVMGIVTEETRDMISIRDRQGNPRTFIKSRIEPPIRLIDVEQFEEPREGNLLLRNGQSRQGVIVKDDFDEVVLEIEGLPARFKREFVYKVHLLPSIDEEYARFKADLNPEDADHWLLLARWLFKKKRYAQTRDELEALLQQHPVHAEAQHLYNIVTAQLALEPRRTDDDDASKPDRPRKRFTPPLTERDVNLIRVYEIDFNNPPRVAVRPDTVRALIAQHGDSDLIPVSRTEREQMFRADPLEIVNLMFRLQARDLYPEVIVNSEPRALNMFRQRVHNAWLMNGCVTSRCHSRDSGPPKTTLEEEDTTGSSALALYRTRMNDPRVRYANLLILERTEPEPGWPLINYDSPINSLIIQYGLPRIDARRPHPEVPGWKPVFPRRDHRMVRQTVQWIDSMMKPRPDYPVQLPDPPSAPASTAASTPDSTPEPVAAEPPAK